MVDAITAYKEEVISGAFPTSSHVFSINDQEWKKLIHLIDNEE